MDRPKRFTQDDSIQEVDRLLQWCVEQLEADGRDVDLVVLIYPTAPLRTVETIEEAVAMVADDEYDSVLSLHEDDSYLWERDDGTVEPTNYDPAKRGPRQKEDWNQWVENKAVYVMDRDLLMETDCRLGGTIGYVEMPEWRSVDVDAPSDLEIARALYNNPPATE
jgi:N-acylneuraminate cytidylyltransferase